MRCACGNFLEEVGAGGNPVCQREHGATRSEDNGEMPRHRFGPNGFGNPGKRAISAQVATPLGQIPSGTKTALACLRTQLFREASVECGQLSQLAGATMVECRS